MDYNPLGLKLAGVCDTPAFAYSVAVEGGYAFVGDCDNFHQKFVKIIDVTIPRDPKLLAACQMPWDPVDVAVMGNYVFTAMLSGDVQVIDVTDRYRPRLMGSCDTPCQNHSVALAAGYAFVANSGAGLQIIGFGDSQTSSSPQMTSQPDCGTPGLFLFN